MAQSDDTALRVARQIYDAQCDVGRTFDNSMSLDEITKAIRQAIAEETREPKSLWMWPIEEIKSAMRYWQAEYGSKLPSEVEVERLLKTSTKEVTK